MASNIVSAGLCLHLKASTAEIRFHSLCYAIFHSFSRGLADLIIYQYLRE